MLSSSRLWQPLSPTKNKLMALLNSAEFENIIGEPPPTKQKAEACTKVPGIPHRPTAKKKGKGKSVTRANKKGKAVPSEIDDKPAKCVEDEDVSEPPKKKGRIKPVSKARSAKRRKAADVGTDRTQSLCSITWDAFLQRQQLRILLYLYVASRSPLIQL